jgi:hypothetical protein
VLTLNLAALDPKPTSRSPSLNELASLRKNFGGHSYSKSASSLKVDYELVRQRRLDQ